MLILTKLPSLYILCYVWWQISVNISVVEKDESLCQQVEIYMYLEAFNAIAVHDW